MPWNETDPLKIQEEGWKRQEREAREQWQKERNAQSDFSSGYGPTESFGDSLKTCAAAIVGTVVIVIVVALIVNFIILHMVH